MKVSHYAGYDFGGTRLKFGLIETKGTVVRKDSVPSPPTMEGLLSLFRETWADLRRTCPGRIRACGFGFAGFYSLKEQRFLQSPNYPPLDGYPLVPALRGIIDVPFSIDNDANLAAFGEYRHGAGRGTQSLVLLTVGTGIGAGVILEGRLWQGACGFAGEIGHITVNPEGALCNCGNTGCLETEASASNIVKNYIGSTGTTGVLTSEDIHRRAKEGDKAALESFAKCGYYLGIGLGTVINLLNPEMILIGGGVVSAGKFLLGPAIEEARRRSHRVSFSCCRIRRASLGNDAGLIGAAAWARANLAPGD